MFRLRGAGKVKHRLSGCFTTSAYIPLIIYLGRKRFPHILSGFTRLNHVKDPRTKFELRENASFENSCSALGSSSQHGAQIQSSKEKT